MNEVWNENRKHYEMVNWYNVIWSKSNCPKMAHTTYKAIKGRLSTKDRLKSWGILNEDICNLCGKETETHNHLFFDCKFSKRVWAIQKLKNLQSETVQKRRKYYSKY